MVIEQYKNWELRCYKQCDQKLIVDGKPDYHINWYCCRAIKQINKNKEYWFNVQTCSSEQSVELAKKKIDDNKFVIS